VPPPPPFFGRGCGRNEREKRTEDELNEVAQLEETIEHRLGEVDPEIEVIAVERPAAEALRIYVDHPEGVDLGLCERVTEELRDLLERWSLEVSSPGTDRPLTKPEHFRRFLGRRVRVRTNDAIDGQRSFTGILTAADEAGVSLESGAGEVTIPFADIRRSNLVPDTGGRA
jgi:ribosome maturation factor RimP